MLPSGTRPPGQTRPIRDLEGEWRAIYPCSLLTARHLKSRLTVYQRTHQERSAPKLPMQEKEQVPPVKKEKEVVTYTRRDKEAGALLARSQSSPLPAPAASRQEVIRPAIQLVDTLLQKGSTEKEQGGKVTMKQEEMGQVEQMKMEQEEPVKMKQEDQVIKVEEDNMESLVWSPAMVSDMFDCLDVARDSLDSTASTEVNPLWLELWLARHPAHTARVTQHLLHKRYLDHVKKASRSYVSQVASQLEEQEEQEMGQEDLEIERQDEWSPALEEELQEEVRHVEGRLRCIKDDHFYELLQVKLSCVLQS